MEKPSDIIFNEIGRDLSGKAKDLILSLDRSPKERNSEKDENLAEKNRKIESLEKRIKELEEQLSFVENDENVEFDK